MRYVMIAAAAVCLCACQPKFVQTDIDNITREIKTQLTANGMIVDDVQLVRETPTKLTGFARAHRDDPLIGRMNVVTKCEATMAAKEARYIWSCNP